MGMGCMSNARPCRMQETRTWMGLLGDNHRIAASSEK